MANSSDTSPKVDTMKNYLFLTFLLIAPDWTHARNPYLVDHNRFYDMPQEEQELFIKKRMEMFVEMESKVPIQTYS